MPNRNLLIVPSLHARSLLTGNEYCLRGTRRASDGDGLRQRGWCCTSKKKPHDPLARCLLGRPLTTVDDVTALLAENFNGLRSGSVDSRIASTVGYLATAMLKALQQGDIEGRLRAMEAVLCYPQQNTKAVKGGETMQENRLWGAPLD